VTNSAVWIGIISSYLCLARIQLGDLNHAESTLTSGLSSDTPMETMGNRHLWAARAELFLAQGQATKALEILDQLIASAPNFEEEGENSCVRLHRLRGDVFIALRRYASAEKSLRGALASARTLELHPQEWRLYASLSRLYRAQGKLDL